jgi:hypothetical protein
MKTVITSDRKAVILNNDGTWKYAASTGSIQERLKALSIPAGIVETVKGMFIRLGVRVIDTGEAFTVIHRGDRVEFASGASAGAVDLTVDVYAFQLERLAEQIGKGSLDELEQFRIARTVFAAAAGKRHMMSNPLMSNAILRRAIRGKNLMHVHVVSPDPSQEPDATFTVMFINRAQLVVPGLHGDPQRVLRVPVAEAIALQKHLFGGMKTGGITKWLKIAKWYVDWRKRVEVPL